MFRRLLIANRGEVALRVLRAAHDLDIAPVALYAPEDRDQPHVGRAADARPLPGRGPRAYLDIDVVIEAAVAADCDAIHPGYGFLAENAEFARRVAAAGLTFVGPRVDLLERLGDKTQARAAAHECGIAVLPGSGAPASVEAAQAFFASLAPGEAMVIKAVHGGGGRGMRVVRDAADIVEAYARCASEAAAACGNPSLYVEALVEHARHLEVQILGDHTGFVTHLWERDCTLQRRHQKLVEMAPSPVLGDDERETLIDAALRLARHLRYENLGTFEFLRDESNPQHSFLFIEANPRLQVEHTVTEEITGIDLVRTQIALAAGRSLAELGLDAPPPPRGLAVQARVNFETMLEDGTTRPSSGTLTTFEVPTGRGIRVDTCGGRGLSPNPAFDSLLAKVIVHEPEGDLPRLLRRAARALAEFRIEGVATNLDFLRSLLSHSRVVTGDIHTRFVEAEAAALIGNAPMPFASSIEAARGRAGARVDSSDPLAVLQFARREPVRPREQPLDAGWVAVETPMQGTVVSLEVSPGALVHAGQPLMILEAMKMEHVIVAPVAGVVREITVASGDTLVAGCRLLAIEPQEQAASTERVAEVIDPERIRSDLEEVRRRLAYGHDEQRMEAVRRRHERGFRTARENITDLVDAGSFVEYGALVVAAQRRRRSAQELIEKTTGDGMVAGIATVNAAAFGAERSRVVAMSYDYLVFAGTQGLMNHRKKDRLFEIAASSSLPVVLFAEGGGGRPGDTDGTGIAGLDCIAFHAFARLSGLVPLVGIANGYCFAGNAALLGCCDVIIATEGCNIGMGGPAMVEGGGLGVYSPDEIGPLAVHVENGVVDIAVRDEGEAVRAAKRYLGYFQGPVAEWGCEDQRLLRHVIPENRRRSYDVRRVIDLLADSGSVLELRQGYGAGIVTALARFEGRPVGVVANNAAHLGGAIDSPGADKAARFIQLCDAFDLPLLFLCDTPGFMVGPEAEKTAQVRRFARLFVSAANAGVPYFTIVLRKGYGLGAQAMAGGSFHAPLFTISWPTGEFGGMGLEGAVKLGFRKELEAIADHGERKRVFEEMVAQMYERGKATSMASAFEIDAVIDPAESRQWVRAALESHPSKSRPGKRRPHVDTW